MSATAKSKVRILIVDDNPEDRILYQRYLNPDANGHYVITQATCGEEGLELYHAIAPDCILLDYNLPDFNGLEFIEELQRRQQVANIAVIMLTGQGSESIAVNALKNGAQDYLVKDSLTSDSLQRAIQHALEKVLLKRQLEENRQKLIESNRELEQFAYIVSHDLQEPLRKIASFTELLANKHRDQLGGDANKYINYIVDGVERMKRLINDLLAYSRVGKQDIGFKPVDCGTVLQAAISNLETLIKEQQAVVTHDGLPTVTGHESQLLQVFQNLIGNSIKYQREKPVKVHVGVELQKDHWLFSVRDNGIGIDPQFAEQIFDVFRRLHTAAEYSGTGIGLSICKKIIERHGGTIWVESELGEGSTFYFTFPHTLVELGSQEIRDATPIPTLRVGTG